MPSRSSSSCPMLPTSGQLSSSSATSSPSRVTATTAVANPTRPSASVTFSDTRSLRCAVGVKVAVGLLEVMSVVPSLSTSHSQLVMSAFVP